MFIKIFVLLTLIQVTNSNYHNVSNRISFLSKEFSLDKWKNIYNKSLNCWSKYGTWKYYNNNEEYYNNSISYIDNYKNLSPCGYNHYNKKNYCYHILDGNVTNYDWTVPFDRCEHIFLKFNTNDLCSILSNLRVDNIVVVGDSMNHQLFNSFINVALVNKKINECNITYMEQLHFHISTLPCDNRSNINVTYFRNDKLISSNVTIINQNKNLFQVNYIDYLLNNSHQNILLILNRGAHYESDDDILLSEINLTLSTIYSLVSNIRYHL
jgi:hypothetical protein